MPSHPFIDVLCVALAVLVGILLAWLLPILPTVPYTADRVTMQPVDSKSSALLGSLCEHHSCSVHFDNWVADILMTSDKIVVLAMGDQRAIELQSSSGVQRVKLGCSPQSLIELASGHIAITCPYTSEVLVVTLESSDHDQIHRIPTKKQYHYVAAHPVDQTLIVATWPQTSIDVITLQGNVVHTLVDTRQLGLTTISSITVAQGCLLVTGSLSKQIYVIPLSFSSHSPDLKVFVGSFTSWPVDTAVDKAGNVFIVLRDGGVLVRNALGGHYRWLLNEEGGWFVKNMFKWRRIALHENRLLLVTPTFHITGLKSVVTEYQLADQ